MFAVTADIRESLLRIESREKAPKCLLMGMYTLGLGRTAYLMARVSTIGLKAINMLGSLIKGRSQGEAYSISLMATSMKDSGLMTARTVLGS
jgi:hypothetical protein